jgi:hypothetical protein
MHAPINKIQLRRPRRGSAIGYMLILLSVITTGLVMTMSLSTGVQSQIAGMTVHRDQAFYAAEAGIQRAQWELEYNNWGSDGTFKPLHAKCGPGSYTATASDGGWNNPVVISSVGTVDTGATPATVTVTAKLTPKFICPAIQLGGDFLGGGGDHITGDLQTTGTIKHTGDLTLTSGNTYATGTIASTIAYDPGFQAFPNDAKLTPPPSITAIATTLRNAAGSLQLSTPTTLNFAASTSGILYYNGDLAIENTPKINGSGTLVVFGNLSIAQAATLANARVNIVVTGNFSTLGLQKIVMQGGLYVGGNITCQAPLSLQGVIVGDQGMTTKGKGLTVLLAPPPPFDPRMGSGPGSRVLTHFTGAIF